MSRKATVNSVYFVAKPKIYPIIFTKYDSAFAQKIGLNLELFNNALTISFNIV